MSSDPLLLAAIRASAHAAEPEGALDELLEIALRLTGAAQAAAFLWDANRGGLAIAGSRGLEPDDLAALDVAAGAADHPVQLAATERLVSSAPAGGAVLTAWPIVVGRDGIEEPLGALALVTADAPVAETEERVAGLADLVGTTVDRARLAMEAGERTEWAERLANSDPLTGLANARTLSRVLELEVARASRQGSALTVALFDVDGLSAINEGSGRQAGDDVLREIAAVLAESVRYLDVVGRWSGDEFLLIAPGATGTTVARRIVETIAAQSFGEQAVTVSAGLAAHPADGTTGEGLLAAAVAALRAAQAMGRGTFALATHAGEASVTGTSAGGGNGPRA